MWDSKLTQPLLQNKLTQDLVAGNPKSVTLTSNNPGMHLSGHNALDTGGVQDLSA